MCRWSSRQQAKWGSVLCSVFCFVFFLMGEIKYLKQIFFRLLKLCPFTCCEQSSLHPNHHEVTRSLAQYYIDTRLDKNQLILHDYPKMQTANRMEEISHLILGLKNKSQFKISHWIFFNLKIRFRKNRTQKDYFDNI